jgi:hypothetical protein
MLNVPSELVTGVVFDFDVLWCDRLLPRIFDVEIAKER